MSSATIDTIVSGFPYQTLTPITGTPTFESLTILQRELKVNAMSVRTKRGTFRDCHLVLTYSPAMFSARSGNVAFDFDIPLHPGENPMIGWQGTEDEDEF